MNTVLFYSNPLVHNLSLFADTGLKKGIYQENKSMAWSQVAKVYQWYGKTQDLPSYPPGALCLWQCTEEAGNILLFKPRDNGMAVSGFTDLSHGAISKGNASMAPSNLQFFLTLFQQICCLHIIRMLVRFLDVAPYTFLLSQNHWWAQEHGE